MFLAWHICMISDFSTATSTALWLDTS